MTGQLRRRELNVLIAAASGDAVLVAADGALPTFSFELIDEERTFVEAVRTIRAVWPIEPRVLELFTDPDVEDDGAHAVPSLLVLEPPAGDWRVPDTLRWHPLDGAEPVVPTELAARARGWLREWRDDSDPPPLRPQWARPGWYERAATWTTSRLEELGRPAIGPVEQIHHWELAAVMRVETATGLVWFKAVFPLFGREPAITELLSVEFPDRVAPVVAIDIEAGWLLLEDIGDDVVYQHPEADDAALGSLVMLQRAFVGRTAEALALGCPARPFSMLAGDVEGVMSHPDLAEWIPVTPSRAGEIAAWIRAAAARIATLPFPDTLVHGDFHPRNVVLVGGRPVIFDWSDAAVAHPLVDVMTWSTWLRDDTGRGDAAWRSFLMAWSDVCPIERVDPLRADLVGLAAGYHAVSYAGIVVTLEPLLRADMASGLRDYFQRLDAAVPAGA